MRAKELVDRIRRLFARPGMEPVTEDGVDAVPVRERSIVVAGCVQFLGLDRVRDRLDDKWPDLAHEVRSIARDALDRHLAPGDVYRLADDASFQICFETDDEGLARERVARISEEIEARVFVRFVDPEAEVGLDVFVAPVPTEGIDVEVEPFEALHRSLLRIREEATTREISWHSLQYAAARFQPIWCNRDSGHTKNRCLIDPVSGAAATRRLSETVDGKELVEALGALDTALFMRSIEGLRGMLKDGKRATIVVPVQYWTLATENRAFMEVAGPLPETHRSLVLIEVMGVPAGASASDLEEVLSVARKISDRVVLQMSPSDPRMAGHVLDLVWGVSLNLTDLDVPEAQLPVFLHRFAAAAQEMALRTFAHGANTIGRATLVVRAGFDHVAGAAVGHALSTPRSQARFSPLFGDPRPKSTGHDQRPQRFAPVEARSSVELPDGRRIACRIVDVSATGAVVVCREGVGVDDRVVLGSLPARVVRLTPRGFAVKFVDEQQPSTVESALLERSAA